MAWIESHQSLREHPKLHKLAALLGVSKREAIGLLHQLWWWAIDYAPTGELTLFEPMQIAKGCEWEGDATKLVRCLTSSRFLDADPLQIHDWFDFCGDLVKRRIERLSAKRQEMSGFAPQKATNPSHPTQPTQPTQPTVPTLPSFGDFWRTYPRKVGKAAAEKAWKRLAPPDGLVRVILAAVERQRHWPQWVKDGGQFIPHPTTWLNGQRWEDEAEEAPRTTHRGLQALQRVDAKMRGADDVGAVS